MSCGPVVNPCLLVFVSSFFWWGGGHNTDGALITMEHHISETMLVRASLIRMPHNPNTLPGNLLYHLLFTMIQ